MGSYYNDIKNCSKIDILLLKIQFYYKPKNKIKIKLKNLSVIKNFKY